MCPWGPINCTKPKHVLLWLPGISKMHLSWRAGLGSFHLRSPTGCRRSSCVERELRAVCGTRKRTPVYTHYCPWGPSSASCGTLVCALPPRAMLSAIAIFSPQLCPLSFPGALPLCHSTLRHSCLPVSLHVHLLGSCLSASPPRLPLSH